MPSGSRLQKIIRWRAHISPAVMKANGTGAVGSALPFGARIRLKADYDISQFPVHLQVILKSHEKIRTDPRRHWQRYYISGAPDDRWDNDELHQLESVKASAFEVVNDPLTQGPAEPPIVDNKSYI